MKKKQAPQTIDEIDALLCIIAKSDAHTRSMMSEMDTLITEIRERFAAALDAESQTREEAKEQIASWAETHKEAFGAKRSLVLTHGVMGWRLGQPSLVMKARVTKESALEAVMNRLPCFVRHVEEVDKAQMLAQYAAGTLTDEELGLCGLRVRQTERFYVDPKTEDNDKL